MTKTQSGIVLIVIAAVLNFTGRIVSEATRDSRDVGIAGAIAILSFISLVVGLFGLFRVIMGSRSKK